MPGRDSAYILRLAQALEEKSSIIKVEGLSGPGVAVVLSLLKRYSKRGFLVITAAADEAERFYLDLRFFLKNKSIYLYPTREILPYEELCTDSLLTAQRINALQSLYYEEDVIVVASIRAIMDRIMPRYALNSAIGYYGVGEEVAREKIVKQLIEGGYRSTPLVEEKGEFSVRGAILDIFPPDWERGCRIEFFGDEIQSIRAFDTQTQRSEEDMGEVILLPVSEILLTKDRIKRMVRRLKERFSSSAYSQSHTQKVADRIERLELFPGIEFYMPYVYQYTESIFSYLPQKAVICLVEPEKIMQEADDYRTEINERFHKIKMRNIPYPSPEELFILPEELNGHYAAFRHISFSALMGPVSLMRDGFVFPYKQQNTGFILLKEKTGIKKGGGFEGVIKRMRAWQREGRRVIITCFNEAQAERLRKMLDEYDMGSQLLKHFPIEGLEEKNDGLIPLSICLGDLSHGVLLDFLDLVLITDEEIFGEKVRVRVLKFKRPSETLSNLNNLNTNDYVVHVEHGIALYKGLIKLELNGMIKDFLQLEFRDGDKLYCPTEALELIQKYSGSGDSAPQLDKLGGMHWANVKSRVKKSIEEMAADLLHLYAEREISKGFSFTSDTAWQTEFEAAFEYEETPDQMKAINEVKRDMEIKRPMDRLVCGDVGYGKTEVAMRAAFKAVMSGKQVAMLAPTTVLVQQHFQKFSSRFSPYPVRVEMLSRFVDKKIQAQILEGMEGGEVDIVIGTHRLLQKDIKFKDIGLLIVDEEHRFGVRHKERIKDIRKEVDCLTLTATPIPRTLHMSLVGIRDMSVIDTPPMDRLPIITYITHFDPELIAEACQREVDRGGQIFYVYNRVKGIEEVAAFIKGLLPHARVVVGHGQMSGKELERVMLDFVHKCYDILICTTIIESGLDIPSVNTIIINNADRFGLAQLYQLRGRVGRSSHRAYAYLLVESETNITDDARKRLMAIQEFTELGSGFRLASRDLEIRGAGNLLGAKQHGHIAAVGFDLYCDLIKETMSELKGEPQARIKKVDINLCLDSHIPDEYIHDINQKLNIYKRISVIQHLEGVDSIRDEIRDRYGPIPTPAENLLKLIEIKILCQRLGIEKLQRNVNKLLINFYTDTPLSIEGLLSMIKQYPERFHLVPPGTLEVGLEYGDEMGMFSEITSVLEKLSEIMP